MPAASNTDGDGHPNGDDDDSSQDNKVMSGSGDSTVSTTQRVEWAVGEIFGRLEAARQSAAGGHGGVSFESGVVAHEGGVAGHGDDGVVDKEGTGEGGSSAMGLSPAVVQVSA